MSASNLCIPNSNGNIIACVSRVMGYTHKYCILYRGIEFGGGGGVADGNDGTSANVKLHT